MHKGNVTPGGGGNRSWRKCAQCGKIIKGDRKAQKHNKEKHP